MNKEALRYLSNAKETLKHLPIENDSYADVKYVKTACGTAYLAILKSLDDYLILKGVPKGKLPKSVEGYRSAIKQHLSVHNGKLQKQFEILYDELHIAGYYRGLLHHTVTVKSVLKKAEEFIKLVK